MFFISNYLKLLSEQCFGAILYDDPHKSSFHQLFFFFAIFLHFLKIVYQIGPKYFDVVCMNCYNRNFIP